MVCYSQHSGGSIRDAIVITGARTHQESVMAEYDHIKRLCEGQKKDFAIKGQEELKAGARHYDVFNISFSDGSEGIIFFDITEAYDKFVIYPQ
jgi:hypothetical protein